MATVEVSPGRTLGFSRLVLLVIAVSIGLSGLVLASVGTDRRLHIPTS